MFRSSKNKQPKQNKISDEDLKPERMEAQASTVNLRGGNNRRAQSVVAKKRGSSSKKKNDSSEFDDLGLSGASYTPMFNQ